MKQPFRFFRGELNGDYVLAFLLCFNDAVKDVIEEYIYWASVVWKLEEEVTGNEMPIRESDVIGLGRFAGILRPLQYIENTTGSIKFTGSHIVDGRQRSDRGLYNMERDVFEFVRTDADEYPTDIVAEATANRRMTLVPDGRVPVGYIPYGVDVFDENGDIIPGTLLATPPVDGTPYAEYYGPEFLTTEIVFKSETEMPLSMFLKYYESIMRIRQNGASITELLFLTELFGEGYITDLEIVQVDYHYTVYYNLDEESYADNKGSRFAAWLATCEKQFKDCTFIERPEV